MSEIIYLLTILYATFVIDDIIGDMQLFILASFGIMIYLITMQV